MRKILITPFLAIILLAVAACGQAQEAPLATSISSVGAAEDTTPALDATATYISTPVEVSTPIAPCELLDRPEIQAIGFTQYDVGEPASGTGVPLGLGEAVKCQWEIGNPNAQFHERLYLYVFQLGPDETPESAYEGQARRMQDTVRISDLGDQAECSQPSQTLLVRDGGLLIYLRADVSAMDEIHIREALVSLAKLILERT